MTASGYRGLALYLALMTAIGIVAHHPQGIWGASAAAPLSSWMLQHFGWASPDLKYIRIDSFNVPCNSSSICLHYSPSVSPI